MRSFVVRWENRSPGKLLLDVPRQISCFESPSNMLRINVPTSNPHRLSPETIRGLESDLLRSSEVGDNVRATFRETVVSRPGDVSEVESNLPTPLLSVFGCYAFQKTRYQCPIHQRVKADHIACTIAYSSVSCGCVVCEFLAVPVFLTSEGQIRSNLLFLLNGTDPRFWLVGRQQ